MQMPQLLRQPVLFQSFDTLISNLKEFCIFVYDDWFQSMNQRQKGDCSSNYYYSILRKMVYLWIVRHVSDILKFSHKVNNILVNVLIV